MARYRSYSTEFKRLVVEELLSGEYSLRELAKRYRLSNGLIEYWRQKYEAGGFNEDPTLAAALKQYEGRVAALERKVGQLTMENELLKKTLRPSPSGNGVSFSIVCGPTESGAHKDADS